MIDLTTRNRKEAELEVERLRSSQIQSERQLETREKTHRQRIKSLEEQISTLRDQLSREIRTRQNFSKLKHIFKIFKIFIINI